VRLIDADLDDLWIPHQRLPCRRASPECVSRRLPAGKKITRKQPGTGTAWARHVFGERSGCRVSGNQPLTDPTRNRTSPRRTRIAGLMALIRPSRSVMSTAAGSSAKKSTRVSRISRKNPAWPQSPGWGASCGRNVRLPQVSSGCCRSVGCSDTGQRTRAPAHHCDAEESGWVELPFTGLTKR